MSPTLLLDRESSERTGDSGDLDLSCVSDVDLLSLLESLTGLVNALPVDSPDSFKTDSRLDSSCSLKFSLKNIKKARTMVH